jgi:solute carrier family 13 (sodium-dependent dicarboxylate transporter), member 2/3/5
MTTTTTTTTDNNGDLDEGACVEERPDTADTGTSAAAAPATSTSSKEYAILPWSAINELNWDVIFLLGGGFALSKGIEDSGLSKYLSRWLVRHGPQQLFPAVIIASVLGCFTTNVMSNIAAANIFLASFACVGPIHHKSPLAVLTPVALCISLAFLFPIGSLLYANAPTNENVTLKQMFNFGLLLTVVSLSTTIMYCEYMVPYMYDMNSVAQSVLDECDVD